MSGAGSWHASFVHGITLQKPGSHLRTAHAIAYHSMATHGNIKVAKSEKVAITTHRLRWIVLHNDTAPHPWSSTPSPSSQSFLSPFLRFASAFCSSFSAFLATLFAFLFSFRSLLRAAFFFFCLRDLVSTSGIYIYIYILSRPQWRRTMLLTW